MSTRKQMRLPYMVGGWVRGTQHYGRRHLIEGLLQAEASATWLVGTRRLGKTSLLRQLEWWTTTRPSIFVPLYWDLQGCHTPARMTSELVYALEDSEARFGAYGMPADGLESIEISDLLRLVSRKLADHGKRLLLLVDEAEALIEVGYADPRWLAWLRKVMLEGKFRTIITATKRLTKLNEITLDATTSPFLSGFHLASLWTLDGAAAKQLVLQSQSDAQVQVCEAVIREILDQTSGHPYLIQFLCKRLFEVTSDGGRLRAPEADDLAPDEILAAFFVNDFQQLTDTERKLVLALSNLVLSNRVMASEQELLASAVDVPPRRVRMLLYGLEKLGYVRTVHRQWTLGNGFLQRWLQNNLEQLYQIAGSAIDENTCVQVLETGQKNEIHYLKQRIALLEEKFDKLKANLAAAADDERAACEAAITELKSELARLESEKASIDAAGDI